VKKKQRRFSAAERIPIRQRLRLRRAARALQKGKLIAHETSTLPGIAASPKHPRALAKLRRFKQRQGPFLLIAADIATALCCFRFLPKALRRRARECWPGTTTLVAPARTQFLPLARKGAIAVRVDAACEVRLFAHYAGGLIVSTSLNRKGQAPQRPSQKLRLRWHRWIDLALPGKAGCGLPSTIERWTPQGWQRLR